MSSISTMVEFYTVNVLIVKSEKKKKKELKDRDGDRLFSQYSNGMSANVQACHSVLVVSLGVRRVPHAAWWEGGTLTLT